MLQINKDDYINYLNGDKAIIALDSINRYINQALSFMKTCLSEDSYAQLLDDIENNNLNLLACLKNSIFMIAENLYLDNSNTQIQSQSNGSYSVSYVKKENKLSTEQTNYNILLGCLGIRYMSRAVKCS